MTKLPLAFLLLLPVPAVAYAQTPCTLAKQVYTCDQASFRAALASAHTIAVEGRPRDRVSPPQLKELVLALGKTAVPAGSSADLTFSIIPLDNTGINVGPSGTDLASLRVYGPSTSGTQGEVLWAETFSGQPDMTWPSVVHALIQQFRARAAK
jgi:hypothetical protein